MTIFWKSPFRLTKEALSHPDKAFITLWNAPFRRAITPISQDRLHRTPSPPRFYGCEKPLIGRCNLLKRESERRKIRTVFNIQKAPFRAENVNKIKHEYFPTVVKTQRERTDTTMHNCVGKMRIEGATQLCMTRKKKHDRQNGGLKLKHYICHNNHKT